MVFLCFGIYGFIYIFVFNVKMSGIVGIILDMIFLDGVIFMVLIRYVLGLLGLDDLDWFLRMYD